MLAPLLPCPTLSSLSADLSQILLQAANLSLDTRREADTIYHWQIHPAVGTLFDRETMHILNQSQVKHDDLWRENNETRVVTMAGWSGCEAYHAAPAAHAVLSSRNGGKKKRRRRAGSSNEVQVIIGRAEVVVHWGKPIKPLVLEPTNWLGPRLRNEMRARLERDEQWAQRRAVAGAGAAMAVVMSLGWVARLPWVIKGVKGAVGLS